jgi:hypothetical protein
MTNQHPLTDEICDQIQDSIHPCDPENMQTAADWQLEQVLEWLNDCHAYNLENQLTDLEGFEVNDRQLMINDLRKAMRPQEDS